MGDLYSDMLQHTGCTVESQAHAHAFQEHASKNRRKLHGAECLGPKNKYSKNMLHGVSNQKCKMSAFKNIYSKNMHFMNRRRYAKCKKL